MLTLEDALKLYEKLHIAFIINDGKVLDVIVEGKTNDAE